MGREKKKEGTILRSSPRSSGQTSRVPTRESKERLRKALELPKPTNDDAFYKKLFGQLTQDKKRDNDLSLIALGPIISGLVFESHFEPDRLTEKALRRILGRIFDALFPARSRQT
jgi:hypothetical protein